MARTYHEPTSFRYSLGAFIQAARSLTFMLQSEKEAFDDFNFYEQWADEAKRNPLLSWLNETRVIVVHQNALATNSWMELRCLNEDESVAHSTNRRVNPFICTHRWVQESKDAVGPADEDHEHQWVRSWELDDLPDRELLEVAADVYEGLSDLVNVAHKEVGSKVESNYTRPIPCMQETLSHRTARINKAGEWVDQPLDLHQH